MMFGGIKAGMLMRTPELEDMVNRAKKLTDGSLDLYVKNYKTLLVLLKKILKCAKQEKEWYVYFYAIEDLMYLDIRAGNKKEIVQYAEVYYKDSALYMDSALPNYPGTRMAALNVWICMDIFDAYMEYHQIDDAKMEAFMQKFEDVVYKYGMQYEYYHSEIALGVLYRDIERTKRAAQNFLKYEKDIKNCYVCHHRPYLWHFLLLGKDEQAEALMLDLIHKNIPKQHLWCYQRCQSAEPVNMYADVLYYCVHMGKKDTFDYFFEKYWSGLPHENRHNSDFDSFKRLLCAALNDFEEYEDDLRYAKEKVMDKEEQSSTYDNMRSYLNSWCYFLLLDKSGVPAVSIAIPTLETDENGMVSTLAVSTYMEEKADTFGRLFAQARAMFDYDFVKSSYRKCFL